MSKYASLSLQFIILYKLYSIKIYKTIVKRILFKHANRELTELIS